VDGQRVVGGGRVDADRDDPAAAFIALAAKVAPACQVELPAVDLDALDDSPIGRLHLMRGISLYYANNPDPAIAYCLRAVRLDPRLVEARLWIARAYLRLGEVDHARAELKLLEANRSARNLGEQVLALRKECDARDAGLPPTPATSASE